MYHLAEMVHAFLEWINCWEKTHQIFFTELLGNGYGYKANGVDGEDDFVCIASRCMDILANKKKNNIVAIELAHIRLQDIVHKLK